MVGWCRLRLWPSHKPEAISFLSNRYLCLLLSSFVPYCDSLIFRFLNVVSGHGGLCRFTLYCQRPLVFCSRSPFIVHSKELVLFRLVISIVAQRHSPSLPSLSQPRNQVTSEANVIHFRFHCCSLTSLLYCVFQKGVATRLLL